MSVVTLYIGTRYYKCITFFSPFFPPRPTFLQNDIAPPHVYDRITFIYLHARASVYVYYVRTKTNYTHPSNEPSTNTQTHKHTYAHTHTHILYIIYDLLETYVMFIVRAGRTHSCCSVITKRIFSNIIFFYSKCIHIHHIHLVCNSVCVWYNEIHC